MRPRRSKRKAIAAVLGRVFRVTDQETPRLASMGLLFFLLMGGLGIGRAANESFFLEEAGAESIPLMYVLNAALMALVSFGYSLMEDRIGRYRFFLYLLLIFSGALVGLRFLIEAMDANRGVLAFAIFGYYELFIIIFQMHFWTYANDIFDPREGKRIFPYIGGMGIAGNIAGSVLAAPLVAAFGGTGNLFLAWAAVIALGIPATRWVRRTALEAGIVRAATREGERREGGLSRHLQLLWQEPLIRRLAIIQAPLWAVVHTVDWLFLTAMEEMTPDLDQRTAQLGLLNGAVSATGLLVQFFFTGLILRRVGVGAAFSSYSISMTIGAGALLLRSLIDAGGELRDALHPRRLLAFTARFVDESILYSIYESAQQLLYNALPSARRGLARALVGGFVEPAATAAVGLILLLASSLNAPQSAIAGTALCAGFVWIFLSLRVQRDYSTALMHKLRSRDIDQREQAVQEVEVLDRKESLQLLSANAFGPDEEAAVFSIRLIGPTIDSDSLRRLAEGISLAQPLAQAEILRLLGEAAQLLHEQRALQAAARAIDLGLHHSNALIRAAAVSAAGRVQPKQNRRLLLSMLKDRDILVAEEALLASLRGETKITPRNPALLSLQRMSRSRNAERKAMAARVCGALARPELRGILNRLASDGDSGIRYAAVRALARYGDHEAIHSLVACLDDRRLSAMAADTMARMGADTQTELLAQLGREDLSVHQRAVLLATLGDAGDASAIEAIGAHLTNQALEIEDAAIGALAAIKGRLERDGAAASRLPALLTPALVATLRRAAGALIRRISLDHAYIVRLRNSGKISAVTLLIDSLARISQHRQEIALKFLEMLGDAPAVRAAGASLRNRTRRSVSEAIELLEDAGPEAAEFAAVLEATLRDSPQHSEQSEYEMMIDLLIQKPDPWFMSCVVYTIGELRMQELSDHVHSLTKHAWPAVRANATLALKKLGRRPGGANSREVQKMSRSMERILFLRSVPIFADVDGADLQWINEIARERRFRRGHVIFRENEIGDSMYLILRGQARVQRGAVTLQLLGERDCFGEMSILDNEPRSATVTATRDSVMLAIKRDDFQRLLLARPQISFSLFRTISRRLREATAKLAAS